MAQSIGPQQVLRTEQAERPAVRREGGHAVAVARAVDALQGTVGNHGVLRRRAPGLQARLIVGQPGDAYEQEADRVAEAVLRAQPGEHAVIPARPVAAQANLVAQRRAVPGSGDPVPSWGLLPAHAQNDLAAKGYSGDWFDRQSAACRLTILNLYVKLRGMGFWDHIRGVMVDETNQFPGRLNFFVRDVRALKQDLRSRWNFRDPEASDTEKWDSAEKRVSGALHFKHFGGWPQDKVEAHVDQAGVWLGSKLFFWIGLPVTLIRHGLTLDSYKDPFGIRAILLEQGWDRQSLLGVAPAAARRKAAPESSTAVPAVQGRVDSLKGRGEPLPGAVRAFFEPRFGHDFGQVRVHTGVEAAETARALNAVAYTVGHDVVFAAGEYAPGTAEGRRLLAHELAHVVQQEGIGTAGDIQRQPAPAPSPSITPVLTPAEERRLRGWILDGQVQRPGLRPERLTDNRQSNQRLLAEAILAWRGRLPPQSSVETERETGPEIAALASGPVARVYEALTPGSADRFSPAERKLFDGWLANGKAGEQALTGNQNYDLDVLARQMLFVRTGLRVKHASAPTAVYPEIGPGDTRYLLLLNGPVRRGYEAWTDRLRNALPKGDVIRGNSGEPRDAAMRRINWLYRRYGIPDWPQWYKDKIKPTRFLGVPVIYGVHLLAGAALKLAEQKLGFPEKYPRYPEKAVGGGYNVRGWGDKLGSHDLGMAIDIYARKNIEVLGGKGWMGSAAGRDRIAAVTILTSTYFSLSEYARSRPSERVKNVALASKAHEEIKAAVRKEMRFVEGYEARGDELRWEVHLDDLLNRAGKLDAYPDVLLKMQAGKPKSGKEQRKAWLRFLAGLQPHLVSREFFNIPGEVVKALWDSGFVWMPFHHFEMADWKKALKGH